MEPPTHYTYVDRSNLYVESNGSEEPTGSGEDLDEGYTSMEKDPGYSRGEVKNKSGGSLGPQHLSLTVLTNVRAAKRQVFLTLGKPSLWQLIGTGRSNNHFSIA